ncbi:MAG: pyridoxal-5'-phosphate-dependent protein subunit beta [Ilumatobacteraceae bacterium]
MIDQLGLADSVVDEQVLANSVARFREQGITLPTFAQLADPSTIDPGLTAGVDKDAADARNLFRVHWYNDLAGNRVEVPDHVVLPKELTGVDSPIIVVFGDRFPMITAHKVLAAYSCLAPRVICGQFDPTVHRAVWPSTGNYARGGIAISRIMACRGVAILPEGMSQERFDWLDRWCANPAEDVIKTVGTESNVKEIYDACNALAKDPGNFILNQFAELGNHLGHYEVTGRALGHVFEHVAASHPGLRLAAFTSATGSAGTIAAGDRLKDDYGTKIVAVEALECPTMLENGFGEHNIQGIGDKHIPLIQNVMNTDVVVGISDKATDELDVLYNSPAGQAFLADRKGVSPDIVAALEHFGFSSTCNVLAAIKTAKLLGLGADDAIITVATDGGAMYPSERAKTLDRRFGGSFDASDAAEVFGEHLAHVDTSDMIECTEKDRTRIFNLGYYTWVEQQGTPFDLFTARRSQDFWRSLRRYLGVWDELIEDFNARVAANG